MQPLMKLVHLLSVIAFLGATVVALVLSVGAPRNTIGAFSAARAGVYVACFHVALPAMMLALTTGLLLMVNRAGLVRARWVHAKAVLGIVIALVALLAWLPAVQQITASAEAAMFGSTVLSAQPSDERMELMSGAALIALAVAAVTIAVYRPRWGRGSAGGAE